MNDCGFCRTAWGNNDRQLKELPAEREPTSIRVRKSKSPAKQLINWAFQVI